jgi:hypothetical protein
VRSGAIVGLVEWEVGVGADASVGEIHAIHVASEERGRGVGWRLLDAAAEALRTHGVRRAILWVVEDNSTARAFYERQGWAWDGTVLARPLGGFPEFPSVVEVRYGLELPSLGPDSLSTRRDDALTAHTTPARRAGRDPAGPRGALRRGRPP